MITTIQLTILLEYTNHCNFDNEGTERLNERQIYGKVSLKASVPTRSQKLSSSEMGDHLKRAGTLSNLNSQWKTEFSKYGKKKRRS